MLMHTQRHRSRRLRGVSFAELIISQTIIASLIVSLMFLFVSLLQQERSNLARMNMAFQAAKIHRELRSIAAVQGAIDEGEGGERFVRFSRRRSGETIISELRFIDADDDPNTIIDNEIRLVRDITNESEGATVVRFVSPLRDPGTGAEQPIFTRTEGSPAPLIVRFRIGDRNRVGNRRQDEQARLDDSATGRGFQSLVFSGAYAARADNIVTGG